MDKNFKMNETEGKPKTQVEPLLKEAWEEVKKEACEIGLQFGHIIRVCFSSAHKSNGTCRYVPNDKYPGFILKVSRFVGQIEWKDVLRHEICHAYWQKGGHGHGSIWKSRAALFNNRLGCNIKRTNSRERVVDAKDIAKYQVSCESCGKTYYRYRSSRLTKSPQSFKCGTCKGRLVVTVLR